MSNIIRVLVSEALADEAETRFSALLKRLDLENSESDPVVLQLAILVATLTELDLYRKELRGWRKELQVLQRQQQNYADVLEVLSVAIGLPSREKALNRIKFWSLISTWPMVTVAVATFFCLGWIVVNEMQLRRNSSLQTTVANICYNYGEPEPEGG